MHLEQCAQGLWWLEVGGGVVKKKEKKGEKRGRLYSRECREEGRFTLICVTTFVKLLCYSFNNECDIVKGVAE